MQQKENMPKTPDNSPQDQEDEVNVNEILEAFNADTGKSLNSETIAILQSLTKHMSVPQDETLNNISSWKTNREGMPKRQK